MMLLANLAALAITLPAPTLMSPTSPCDWDPPAPSVPPDCHSIEVNIAIEQFYVTVAQATQDCHACMNEALAEHCICVIIQAGLNPWQGSLNCWAEYKLARMVCSVTAGTTVVQAILTVNATIEAICGGD